MKPFAILFETEEGKTFKTFKMETDQYLEFYSI